MSLTWGTLYRESILEWKEKVVQDKKLRLDIFKKTQLLWIDTGTAEAKFQSLFQKIESNKDINTAIELEKQRQSLENLYGVPESLAAHNQLALQRFATFEMVQQKWYKDVGDLQANLQKANSNGDVYKALEILNSLRSKSSELLKYFTDNRIALPQKYIKDLQVIKANSNLVIKKHFSNWLTRSVYCKSIDKMSSFANFCMRCQDLFIKNGYGQFADEVEKKSQKELSNKEEIKSRTTLLDDANKFILDYAQVSNINYIEIENLIKRSSNLDERFKKYVAGMGIEASELYKKVISFAEDLKKIKLNMDSQIQLVYDTVSKARTVVELAKSKELFVTVLGYNIKESKRTDLNNLQRVVEELNKDCQEVLSSCDNRTTFEKVKERIVEKYSSSTLVCYMPVVADSIEITKQKIDNLDKEWCEENVTLGDKTRQSVHIWKQKINALPAYLSEQTIAQIKLLDVEANQIISDGKIEDVVFYFDKLDRFEKEKCLDLLKMKC